MFNRALKTTVFLCLLLVCAHSPPIRAQTVSPPIIDPTLPFDGRNFYTGTAIWQQPDGSTLRGDVSLEIFALVTPGQPDKLRLSAQFDFGAPTGAFFYSFLFAGKVDPNGRGFLRHIGEVVTSFPQGFTVLDPGRVPVLVSNQDGTASGGVLAEDGTQLTFRALPTTFSSP